jgi:hypothetical protein
LKWVTWENVGVDRMACAWLIRRSIDPHAQFVFVPAGHKPLPPDSEPFDIPASKYSHRRGHCTFHTFLREFHLADAVMDHIAQIVDEADVVQEANIEPAAPGLDSICRGLRRISKDDQDALERGRVVFDALYAELSAENK